MDIVSVLNKMDPVTGEYFFNLPPEERSLIYTRGIVMTILENEFNSYKQKDIMYMIQCDPELYNIKNITTPKVILKAAKNKILYMKTVDEIHAYMDYLGLHEEMNYPIFDADKPSQLSPLNNLS
jgi:hypothetical protein